jgi:RHS repeat-associated protein
MQYLVSPTSTGYTTEAKGFNANGQLASMTWSGGSSPVTGSLQYSYSATQNNGQITQVVDTVSGETIVYQYDALKRLTSATSTPNTGSSTAAWTETFQYDGYGNLTAKVLNGTTTSIAVNAATNQLSSASYDYNGNMTSGVGATFTFDVANRMLSAAEVSGGVEYYGYAPDNKRIYKKLTSGVEEYTFYGGRGEKLGVYNLTSGTASALRTNVWFAGKLISENGSTVFEDRVGTNRASGARFYPFGDEITSTANDRQKFGTYTRDGYTGLDNAEQRFYASSLGRFNTPDPGNSGYTDNPLSLNLYNYTGGDPINFNDPSGLITCGNLPVDGGGTVSSYLNAQSDTGTLTRFVWAEGGTLAANDSSQSELILAQETIAQAVENRIGIANSQIAVQGVDGNVYWGDGSKPTTLPASNLGYGSIGTTLPQEIVRAAGGTNEVDGSGQLNDMSGLVSTLSTELGDPTRPLAGRVPVALVGGAVDYVTPECDRAISSFQATNGILGVFSLNTPSYLVTSWKANGNSNPDPTRLAGLGFVGGTTFFGFQLWTPLPVPGQPHIPVGGTGR